MKQIRYLNYGFLVLPIIALIIALASLPFLPDLIPFHWNGAGIVERTGSKLLILLFPAISFFIVVSGYLKPKIDPKGDNYNKMPREYRLIHFLILIFILGFRNLLNCLYIRGTYWCKCIYLHSIRCLSYSPRKLSTKNSTKLSNWRKNYLGI